MNDLKARLLSVLLLVPWSLSGCASLKSKECGSTLSAARHYPVLSSVGSLQVGEEYYVDGLLYNEFEDSGLVADPRVPVSDLPHWKWDAFCLRWAATCDNFWDTVVARLASPFHVARIRALVRFVGQPEYRPDVLYTQCTPGVVEIVSVVSYRPLRLPVGR